MGSSKFQKSEKNMKPVFETIKVIHQNNAAHYDIRIENIYVTENGDYKLIDFGSCCSIKAQQNNRFGSFLYYPPELLSETKDIQKCDIWAIEVPLYSSETEQFPFDENDSEYFNQVINEEQIFIFLNITTNAGDFSH
jgi:serine/threonine protein kinase